MELLTVTLPERGVVAVLSAGVILKVPLPVPLEDVNVDNANETYAEEFVMPEKSLTIKPIFEPLKQSKLTLVNATFSDGSSEKMVTALDELTLNVTAPSGKKHVGWYDVNSPSLSNGSNETLPIVAASRNTIFISCYFTVTSEK